MLHHDGTVIFADTTSRLGLSSRSRWRVEATENERVDDGAESCKLMPLFAKVPIYSPRVTSVSASPPSSCSAGPNFATYRLVFNASRTPRFIAPVPCP